MSEEILFTEALSLAADQRDAYLDRVCAGNPELRRRLEELLAAHAASGDLLAPHRQQATEAFAPSSANAPNAAEQPPTTAYRTDGAVGTLIAGRYKLLQQIGEGGMGTVWMAEQTEPVKRKVAVKLIRVERAQSKTILARFEAERQAIALMDHPHIAKLLDAGTTDTGSPFFVMELVKGIPLNDFCDQHRLGISERLQLFMQICSAVQHAHQKGIIHRDLKPSNILVESHDGKPVPKVIDFGLAKATTGLTLTEQSLFTGFGNVLGTPLYMAPEQASFNAVDVDTRADIYALGIILYELLTGTTPITRDTLKKVALDEMLRLVREQEVPTPSSRLSSSETKANVAANRHTEPAKLGRYLRGELDWIVLKALAKERDRRYETANGFAKDIERFLNHEPVSAGPPTAGYRIKKFVQRNRPQVIAASLVFLALLAGIIGTTVGLLEARRQAVIAREEAAAKEKALTAEATQRGIAEEQEIVAKAERAKALAAAEQEKLAKEDALRNLGFAKKGNEILGSVFAGLDPKAEYQTVAELRDALKSNLTKAITELEGSAIGDPLEVAAMQNTLGLSLLGLGEANLAIEVFDKSRTTYAARLGPDHPSTLTSMNNLALGYYDNGKLDLAQPLWEETLRLRKAKLGPDHLDTLTSMGNLATCYRACGKLYLALPLYVETLRLRKAKLGPDHPDTLTSMNNLALGYYDAGKLDQALPFWEETLRLRKAKLGPDHLDTLGSMNNLALGYQDAGKLDQALPLWEETLRVSKAKLGPDHPNTLTTINNLAAGYQAAGNLDQALPLWEETLRVSKAKLGPDHPDTLTAMSNLAESYHAARRNDQALPLHEETLRLRKAKLGPDHPDTLISMNNLAMSYKVASKLDQALPLWEETLRQMKAKLGPHHPVTLTTMGNLAAGYYAAGKLDQALPLLEETLKHMSGYGPGHPNILSTMYNLAAVYQAAGRLDLALPLLEETLRLMKAKLGPDHPDTLTTMANLGKAYCTAKQGNKAAPLLNEFVVGQRKRFPNDDPRFAGLLAQVSLELLKCEQDAPAEEMLREALAIREKTEPDAWTTFNTMSMLGAALLGQKKYAAAEPLLLKGYEGMKLREKSIPPEALTVRFPEALDRLIELYTALEKPDEVKKWQAERAKYSVADPQ